MKDVERKKRMRGTQELSVLTLQLFCKPKLIPK